MRSTSVLHQRVSSTEIISLPTLNLGDSEETLSECVKSGWCSGWMCIVGMDTSMSRTQCLKPIGVVKPSLWSEARKHGKAFVRSIHKCWQCVQGCMFISHWPGNAKTSNCSFLVQDDYNLRLAACAVHNKEAEILACCVVGATPSECTLPTRAWLFHPCLCACPFFIPLLPLVRSSPSLTCYGIWFLFSLLWHITLTEAA